MGHHALRCPLRVVSVWGLGVTLSAILVLILAADGLVDLFAPQLLRTQMELVEFPPRLAAPLGMVILVCAGLYAIPRTVILGAVLVTGFVGGAICTHFRVGEIGSPPQLVSGLLGVLAWGGLYCRDARVRALLPWRGRETPGV